MDDFTREDIAGRYAEPSIKDLEKRFGKYFKTEAQKNKNITNNPFFLLLMVAIGLFLCLFVVLALGV